MLIVREAQVQALQRAALPVWIASHLAHFFPLQCAVLGEAGLRERVREGIARAASHGFKNRGADFPISGSDVRLRPRFSTPTLRYPGPNRFLLAKIFLRSCVWSG